VPFKTLNVLTLNVLKGTLKTSGHVPNPTLTRRAPLAGWALRA
jgi:hypothetical protein